MSFVLVISLIILRGVVGSNFTGNARDCLDEVVALSQRQALVEFYDATRMDQLPLKWFDSDVNKTIIDANASISTSKYDYCSFYGVTCDGEGYVVALDLNRSGLVGKLPDLRLLTRLVRLQLNQNFLEGTIPESLWQMSSLQYLYLSENYVVGTLPPVPVSSQLRRLMLASNSFTGTIPESVCRWRRLTSLDLSYNTGIRGTLPECLGDISNLTRLRIDETSLTGTIPNGLCTLREMNGMNPNPFGCDGIGCGAGYYQRLQGRQTSSEARCSKCLVPSNVIGSTRCFWFQYHGHSLPEEAAPFFSQYPTLQPSVSPSIAPSRSLTPFVSTNVVVSDSEDDDNGRHHVTIVSAFLGLAIVAIFYLLYIQIRRRKNRQRTSLQSADSSGEPAPAASPRARQMLVSSLPKIFRLQSEISHAIDRQELDLVAPPPCFGPRGSILRTSPRYKGPAGVKDRECGHLSRRVHFSLPDDEVSSEAIDFCSAVAMDSAMRVEDKDDERLRDPETWASWILNPGIREEGPACSSPDRISEDEALPSSTAVATLPLLSSLRQSSGKWLCCSDDSFRDSQNTDMLWPSNLRTVPEDLPSGNERGRSVQGLVGAFSCGWLRDVHLDELVLETKQESNDVEIGHVEI